MGALGLEGIDLKFLARCCPTLAFKEHSDDYSYLKNISAKLPICHFNIHLVCSSVNEAGKLLKHCEIKSLYLDIEGLISIFLCLLALCKIMKVSMFCILTTWFYTVKYSGSSAICLKPLVARELIVPVFISDLTGIAFLRWPKS